MIKIRHKQTKQVKDIPVYEWDQNHYNHETWDVMAEYNLVQSYMWHPNEKRWLIRNRMEKEDAFKMVHDNPNTQRYDDLPDTGGSIKDKIIRRYGIGLSHSGLLPENLPATSPVNIQTTPHTIIARVGTVLSKILKWTIDKILFILLWVVIAVVGALLSACFLSYYKGTGFKI